MRTKYLLIGVVVVLFSIVAGLLISDALQNSTSGSTAPAAEAPDDSVLSPETAAYLAKAMPTLEKVMRLWSDGDNLKAVDAWGSIGDIPTTTTADEIMADAYLEYANNVRYYMVGDGSATLKDVEQAKSKAEELQAAYAP